MYKKIGLTVVSAFLVICLGMTIYKNGIESSEAASWIQAIGTILAIVVAIELGQKQIIHTKKIEDDLAEAILKRKWLSVKAIADDLYQQCLDQESAFEFEEEPFHNLSFVLTYKQQEFELAVDRIAKIPLFEMDSDILVREVISLQHYAVKIQELVKLAQLIISSHRDVEDIQPFAVKHHAVDEFAALKTAYRRILEVTGGTAITEARAFGRGS